MSKVKKWASRFVSLIFTLIFIFGVYVFATVLTARNREVPMVFGYGFLRVTTGSMEPTFKVGSIIIVKEVSADSIKEGDIICFYSSDPTIEGMPNTHRVKEVTEIEGKTAFITKGDANPIEDEYEVYPEDVVGKYKTGISGSTKLMSIIQSRYFFFFALMVPLCIICIFEIKNLTKATKDKDNEQKPDETKKDN